MNMITTPIGFESKEAMNKWYYNFEEKAVSVCKKYNVPEVWNNANILKDEQNYQLAIISLGSHVAGSPTQKAATEILRLFQSMFDN